MALRKSLSLLQKEEGGNIIQSLSLPYRSGTSSCGVAKLLQNVIAELLTRKGSVRFDTDYGCRLVEQIGVTNASSLSEASHFIYAAVSDVQENFLRRIVGNEPLDEWLDRIEVENLRQEQDRIAAVLRVYSKAGSSASYDLSLLLSL